MNCMRLFFVRFGLALAVLAWALLGTSEAPAAVTCPNPIPVVNENNCRGEGTSDWMFQNYDEGIAGYPTQTSFNLGQSVPLKIARDTPTPGGTKVDIEVFRMGYYGGEGGRLVHSATNIPVQNNFTCNPPDTVTGELSCSNWSVTYTIPGQSLPATGIYVAKLTTVGAEPIENQIVFVIRDDNATVKSQMLFVLPTADYQAYNTWGGKSLYYDRLGGPNTISGTGRAVKVSFDRPLYDNNEDRNRFLGPDFETLYWLEKQGYDISYTDDVAVHQNGAALREHDVVIVPGHSEYWSLEEFHAFEAARDAGTSIASFSANTAYWKVRYEKGGRTLVCYKTVQGDGSGGSGAVTPNDWGPDGIEGTADDALGLDGVAGTADDHPENSTTTFRDNGAPPGDPNAPPGGRVGPDMPENSLFGVMYMGDNENLSFPLSIPPGDALDQYSADRVWRNTGISQSVTTDIGSELVGWEWDAVPTQAQYLAKEPAGVKRIAATDVDALGGISNSWLVDEGRQRTNFPPAGQPGTAEAVRYTAPSGAEVFAAGTMRWARGLGIEDDPRIEQATYNLFSEMGVQPVTPVSLTIDPAGSNKAPIAAFSVSPSPVGYNTTVTFDASASKDPDGQIAKYEWDLDGNGTYETNTGTNPVVTHKYTADAMIDVRLRVADQSGATDVSVRTLNVIGNQFPIASFSASPNPVIQGLPVQFDASASKDPDGSIAKYEWDLDGNGTYETNTGKTPTTSHSYASVGTVQVGLRVTDNGGKTATETVPVTVSVAGVSSYPDAVKDTPGLIHYWRMGEANGPIFVDSIGGSNAIAQGGPAFGVPGGVAGDPDLAARFDGLDDAARAPVDLSGLSTITVEFWLYVDAYTNDDALTLEQTDNFNQNQGGFIVDPNAPQAGGSFGIGIGTAETRNNVFFERPSAGQWHHYAIVLDSAAPGTEQIVPYVDGKAVSYTKTASGTNSGPFANSTLNFMSRGGQALFSRGVLDEVAIYNHALSSTLIAEHEASFGTNRRPVGSFTVSPQAILAGTSATFDASGSKDPDGQIVKYEWDLDGNGSYETDTGSNPVVSHAFATNGEYTVGLRLTDNLTGTDATTRTVKVGPQPPSASLTAEPNPTVVGIPVHLDASGSSDPDGQIVKYEWDLDGNGSYETDTGSTPTTEHTYQEAATVTTGLRVTDNDGASATTTLPVTVGSGGVSSYGDAVLATPGLLHYWRLGEESGPTLADSQGTANGTASAGVSFGVAGAVAGDPNTALGFAGEDSASAPLDLSGTSKATIEFWLKWDSYADDDSLAMELTENFNQSDGGFIVDPNAPQAGGSFGIGIGVGASRNNVFFERPSAGQWHHYAIVLDSAAPGTEQIVPYVDGKAVSYSKTASGVGAGAFANSTLYMMSRAGSALFGHGGLDELAVYDRDLSAAEIDTHYASHGSNHKPSANLTIAPNPVETGKQVTFDASGSTDSDGSIIRYQWDLDGNGSYETDTGSTPTASSSFAKEGQVAVSVRVYDDGLAVDTATKTLTVGSPEPQPPTASFSAQPNPAIASVPVHLDASGSSDPDGQIVKYEWDLDGNGSYETDTGSTPTTTHVFSETGTVDVGLRVTDDSGMTDSATVPVTVGSGGVSSYGDAVLATPGLLHYWRLGEESGPTLADSQGTANGTASAGVSFGVAGAVAGDPNTALGFAGEDSASAPLDLSGTSKATIEFWLKWDSYADDDSLAMELTENFNQNDGGFIVDPNASQGEFGVGIGRAESRNNIYFERPSVGQWHHYAIVLDSAAPGAEQIVPYVDGKAVAYTKGASGTGAGTFANSTLYMMSRAGSALFGHGGLDELAVYDRDLSAAEIAEHVESHGVNRRPHAALGVSPNPVETGKQVTFDASGSTDSDGSIIRYQWDLDGNGSYETDTGSTPTASSSFAKEGQVSVSVRVVDDGFGTDTETKTLTVENPAPPVSYSQLVLSTEGLVHYWRLNEEPGSTSLDDIAGGATASTDGGVGLGSPGPLGGSAGSFDGLDDFAQAQVDLSGTSQLTVEFWLRWAAYADDDSLAMELTPNFNANDGGLLIDPNASGGSFGVAIGNSGSRNNVFFERPSAGQWHHYAFVLNTIAPAAEQIVPYVDGQPVTYSKSASGEGAGAFADAPLYFMSRSGSALFGTGSLDEVALYDRTLSPAQIAAHFGANAD